MQLTYFHENLTIFIIVVFMNNNRYFSELYLAPEMMYASLGLPVMVKEATKDLPQQLIKDCFSNILITQTLCISSLFSI